jgi:uncharacterized protein YbjQ (UPF0145 family)
MANPQYPQQQPNTQQQYQGYPQQQQVGQMDHSLVTSAFTLPGYAISRNFGIVRGITVRSRNAFAQIGAGFQQLVGGNISIYTQLCEQARNEAYVLMMQHAAAMGANAVIGVRYDATELTSGVTEVLCYGTAVFVTPEQR